ncbi:MAG: flavodoxin [Synergistes sp.]|nr:flavodoxin [Synergistes sp.]
MKIITVISIFAAAAAALFAAGTARSEAASNRALVVFYSRSGNTASAAKTIQKILGCDLFEIKTTKAYPADYNETIDIAKKEQRENARPELQTKEIPGLAQYDTVIFAAPCWWGTFPMAFMTLFEANDFSGKEVTVLMTHGGSGLGHSENDLAKYCPKSKRLKGLAISGSSVNSSEGKISEWLSSIGIK